MTGLPAGWRRASISALGIRAQPGFASGAHSRIASGVPHLRPMNISRLGQIDLSDVKYVEDRTDRRVAHGDVLFNNTNSPALVGKTAYVTSHEPLAYSNHMTRLRYDAGTIDGRFLAYQLHGLWAADYFKAICSNHVNQASVASRRLAQVEIAVAPLEEQRGIVDILEDHLSRLDAAVEALRVGSLRSKAWRTSLTDQLIWRTASPKTPVASLLSEPLRNGHSARASTDATGIRTLTLTAVTQGSFDPAYTKMTVAQSDRVSDLWLRPGDILVERANTAELVGTAAYYDGPENWAIFPDLLIRVRVDREVARPQFVAMAMSSERAHRWMRSQAKGLAGSMPKIDQGTVGALMIPNPSLDNQDAALAGLEVVVQASQRLTSGVATARRRADTLRRALLKAAFSGRLTSHASDVDFAEEPTA